MLGYISSTRKKSCRQCVKAKRRCDLGYPYCKRCSTKALDCAYPNAEAYNKAEVVIKATPNVNQPTTSTKTARTTITAPTTTAAEETCLDFGAPMEPVVSGLDMIEEWDGWCAEMGLGMASAHGQAAINPSILDGSSPPDNHDNTAWSSLIDVENDGRLSVANFQNQSQLRLPADNNSDSTSSTSSKSRSSSPSTIHPALLPNLLAPAYLNSSQLRYVVSALRSFIPDLAQNGHNCFVHSQLYADMQPSAYEDSVSLAALYTTRTKKTIPILNKTIQNKVASLIATSPTWTLEEHLAAVQAMIVYQTMRLFDPALQQQTEAVPHNDLLALWAAHLWKRSFTSPIGLPDGHASWVFYESLRRTVLISVLLRGGWHSLTHDGVCNQVPVLNRLPLSLDEDLWTENGDAFTSRNPWQRKRAVLTTYGEFSHSWIPGRDDPASLSDFHRMLLVACRGKEDPRLFFKEPSTVH